MTDYSKWEALAREEEAAEAREKELRRAQNRAKYYADQEEKKRKYDEQQAKKKADAHTGGHSHEHEHAHGNAHGHSHGPAGETMQPLLAPLRRPACGCGYADVEEMKRAAEEAAAQPQLTTEEKNQKKIAAVQATREHGKQLYQEGKYEEAFAVYERGVLIVTGILDVAPEVAKEMTDTEVLLDLNMAMCKLKLKQWQAAIDQCRMALQLDSSSVKAHFRWGQALIGLGEYEQAREHFQKSLALDATGAVKREIQAQLTEIKRLEARDRENQQKWTRQLEAKMRLEASAQPSVTAISADAAISHLAGVHATDAPSSINICDSDSALSTTTAQTSKANVDHQQRDAPST